MVMSRDTVLVVDDEPLIRMSLAASFEEAGFIVAEARNVLDAVALLTHGNVAALVTDVDLPGGLSGLDLVDLVSATCRSTAILIVSGRGLPGDYQMPAGTAFHSKPYSHSRIVAEVSAKIGIQGRRRAAEA